MTTDRRSTGKSAEVPRDKPNQQVHGLAGQQPGGADIHRHLGQLEGRMEGLEERQTRFEMRMDSSLGELNGKVDQVIESLANREGKSNANWRTIGLSATVVSFLVGLMTWTVGEFTDVPATSEIADDVESALERSIKDGD